VISNAAEPLAIHVIPSWGWKLHTFLWTLVLWCRNWVSFPFPSFLIVWHHSWGHEIWLI